MNVDDEGGFRTKCVMKKTWLISLNSFTALAFIAIISGCSTQKRSPEAVTCSNQMISIGFSARLWSEDNGGYPPPDMLSMSNEVAAPKILICPSDYSRRAATNWASFTSSNCSYEMVAKRSRGGDTNAPFLRCPIHDYVLRGDGAVFDGDRRLRKGSSVRRLFFHV
jgi:hypothetical protein